MGQNDKAVRRQKIKLRSKTRGQGTAETPRLCVFRSVSQIYAQLIDDVSGRTIVSASSAEKSIRDLPKFESKVAMAEHIGKTLGERALEAGLKTVVFDRNGFLYHGRVKAVSKGARDVGLVF